MLATEASEKLLNVECYTVLLDRGNLSRKKLFSIWRYIEAENLPRLDFASEVPLDGFAIKEKRVQADNIFSVFSKLSRQTISEKSLKIYQKFFPTY